MGMQIPKQQRQILPDIGTVPLPPMPNASPSAFGENVAQAQGGISEPLENVASILENQALRLQKEANDKSLLYADSQFNAINNDRLWSTEEEEVIIKGRKVTRPKGIMNRSGESSADSVIGYDRDSQQDMTRLLNSAPNNYVRTQMQEFLGKSYTSTRNSIIKHEATQLREAKKNMYQGSIAEEVDKAYTSQDPMSLRNSISNIKQKSDLFSKFIGVTDPDSMKVLERKNVNQVLQKSVSGSLEGDITGSHALALLDTVKDDITKEEYETQKNFIAKTSKTLFDNAQFMATQEKANNGIDLMTQIATGTFPSEGGVVNIQEIGRRVVAQEIDPVTANIAMAAVNKPLTEQLDALTEPMQKKGNDFIDSTNAILDSATPEQVEVVLRDIMKSFTINETDKMKMSLLFRLAQQYANPSEKKKSLRDRFNDVVDWGKKAMIENSNSFDEFIGLVLDGRKPEEVNVEAVNNEVLRQNQNKTKEKFLDDRFSYKINDHINNSDANYEGILEIDQDLTAYLMRSGVPYEEAVKQANDITKVNGKNPAENADMLVENIKNAIPQLKYDMPKTLEAVEKFKLFHQVLDFLNPVSEAEASEVEDVSRETRENISPINIKTTNRQMSQKEVQDILKVDENGNSIDNGKIRFTSSSKTIGLNSDQTGIEGLREDTVNYLKNFTEDYDLNLIITGGTEIGVHADHIRYSHKNGYKFDTRKNEKLDSIISSWKKVGKRPYDGAMGYKDPNNNVIFWDEGKIWDVEVKPFNEETFIGEASPDGKYYPPLTDEDKARAVVEAVYLEKGKNLALRKIDWAIRGQQGQAITKAMVWTLLTHGAYPIVEGVTGALEETPKLNTLNKLTKGILYPEKTKKVYERFTDTNLLPQWAKIVGDVSEDVLKYGGLSIVKNMAKSKLLARNLSRKIDDAAGKMADQIYGNTYADDALISTKESARILNRDLIKEEFKKAYVEKLRAIDTETLKTGFQEYAEKKSLVGLLADEVALMDVPVGLSTKLVKGSQVSFNNGQEIISGIVEEITGESVKIATAKGLVVSQLSKLIPILKNTDPLIEEAKKYNSAEEFVKNIRELPTSLLRDKNVISEEFGTGIRTRDNLDKYRSLLEDYSVKGIETPVWEEFVKDIKQNGVQTPVELYIEKDGKITIVEGTHRLLAAEEAGIQNVPIAEIRGNINKAPKQLTDIWNKAQGEMPETIDWDAPIEPPSEPPSEPPIATVGEVELLGKQLAKGVPASKVKGIIRENTGMIKVGDVIDESKALKRLMQVKAKLTAENEKEIQSVIDQELANEDLIISNYEKDIAKLETQLERKEWDSVEAKAKSENKLAKLKQDYADKVENRRQKDKLKKEISSLVSSIAKAPQQKIAVEYEEMINQIKDKFDLKNRQEKTLGQRDAMRTYVEDMKMLGKPISIPEKDLEMLDRVQLKDMTMDQLRDISQTIDNLEKLGHTKQKAREVVYTAKKEKITNDLMTSVKAIKSKQIPNAPIGTKPNEVVKRLIETQNYIAKTKVGLTPIQGFSEATGMEKVKDALDVSFGNYLKFNEDDLTEWYDLTRDMSDSNFERIGAKMLSIREGGLERLANSGRTKEEIDAIVLTPEEQEAYDLAFNLFTKNYPAIKDYMKDVYNLDVGKSENYVSFISDSEQFNDLENYDRFGNRAEEAVGKLTKKVEAGFTKSTVEGAKTKLLLNIDKVLTRHLDDVAYMLNMGKDIKMYYEIVNSPKMREALGDIGALAWLEYLDLMARKGGSEGAKRIAALDVLRKNFGVATLAFRLSTVLIQLSSFGDTMATMGAEWATKGAVNVASSPEWRNFILDNFPEVKNAVGDDIAYRELTGTFLDKATKIGYTPMRVLDGLMRLTAASGAYEKICAQKGIPVDFANPNKEIIAEATKLMRESQGSSFYKDQPLALTTGFGLTPGDNLSLNKAILSFQSFVLNKFDNAFRQIYRLGIKEKNYSKAAMSLLWMIVFSAAVETGARRTAKFFTRMGVKKDKKDEKSFVQETATNMVGNIPLLGSAMSSIAYSSSPIPALNVIDDVAGGIKSVATGKKLGTKIKGAVRVSTGIAGMAGVPGASSLGQIIKERIPKSGKSGFNKSASRKRLGD